MTEEALQWLKQGLGTFDRATIMECIQILEDMIEKVYHGGATKSSNEEDGRSVSPNQQVGTKGSATIDILQELTGDSLNTSKSHTRKLHRGASRARSRLPICNYVKV